MWAYWFLEGQASLSQIDTTPHKTPVHQEGDDIPAPPIV